MPSNPPSFTPTPAILYSFATPEELTEALASFILKAQFDAIEKKGRFTLALSGGSLPKMLAGLPAVKQVEWEKWHIFFADERAVPLNHEDSNYRLCKEEFFSKVPEIPAKNIHAINETLLDDLEELAEDYKTQLIETFASKTSARFPVFDLILLGMGPDGHTASLFPDHPLLTEDKEWVASIDNAPKNPPRRITLSLPVINHATRVAFVASGEGKQKTLARVFDNPGEGLPCSRVKPRAPGVVYWFVDDAASNDTQYPRTAFKLQ